MANLEGVKDDLQFDSVLYVDGVVDLTRVYQRIEDKDRDDEEKSV